MATSVMEERPSPRTQSQDSPSEEHIKDQKVEDAHPAKKTSILARIWVGSGLNIGMLMMMVKGALPPTISLAVYQSTAFADIYSTLGYLVAIMSVLSFAILPRSKFLQTMLLNVVGVCIGASIALLEIYCSVQARAHTTAKSSASSTGPSPGAAVVGYNSSASAVCAIWLFSNIYVVNTLRASRPQLQFPAIMYSIFANVASVYAPSFPDMVAGQSFTKRLLESFLTGFAIATGVSLFVFPTTVRMTFFKQSAGFIKLVQGTLKTQVTYLQTLEKPDMFAPPSKPKGDDKAANSQDGKKAKQAKITANPETQKLKAAISALGELHGKIHADIAFAKREVAWGKLCASDISEMLQLMQGIILPLTGMSSAADIFQRLATRWGWTEDDDSVSALDPAEKVTAQEIKNQWNGIMKTLHDPFEAMTEAMNAGLQHTLYTLELAKPPKKQKEKPGSTPDNDSNDVEAEAGVIKPGDAGYAKYLEQKVEAFYEKRKSTLRVYCLQRGITLDDNPFDNISEAASKIQAERESQDPTTRTRNRRQLYLVLYVSYKILRSNFPHSQKNP